MHMPDLNAEASLYRSKGRYRAPIAAQPNVPQAVVPQSEKSECEHNCWWEYSACVNREPPFAIPSMSCEMIRYNCLRRCRFLDPWEH
jgi:hypothetical protein